MTTEPRSFQQNVGGHTAWKPPLGLPRVLEYSVTYSRNFLTTRVLFTFYFGLQI